MRHCGMIGLYTRQNDPWAECELTVWQENIVTI
jgi:hypothetical protein